MQAFEFILILLAWAVGVVSIFRRIQLPPILGYLFVGALVGPGGLGLIPKIQDLNFLAEFGVVFLMFSLGLEFSLPQLMTMKKAVLGLGGLQVVLCTLIAALGGWYLGLEPKTAFIAGGALALSSTAVVVKMLTEQKEIHTPYGRLSVSILLFQDLAAVLFLILIPALSTHSSSTSELWNPLLLALTKGIGAFVVMAIAGQWLLRPLFHEVAKARSTEVFMLATLFVTLGAAWITHKLDLSMALGAFLAGMMLGETEFRPRLEIDMRPFRDVLLGLFFITVGALLNITELPEHWYWVAIILVSLLIIKTFVITTLVKLFSGFSTPKAFRTGLILAQGGEFGFVILTVAINHELIDPEQMQVLVAAVVLSIVIAPFLIRHNKAISNVFFRQPTEDISETAQPYLLAEHAAELKDHIIICGFGRVGQILARFLEQEHIPHIALDLDPMRIASSALAGEKAFYGDARHPEILAAAGLARARMIVISFADEPAALETLKHIRSLRLDIPVFVRTRNDSNLKSFQDAGATEVVPESLEASLMLASHLLLNLGVPASKVVTKIRSVQSDRYRMLQGFFKGSEERTQLEDEEDSNLSLNTITVPEKAFAIGKTLRELSTAEAPFPIKSLIRESIRYTDPDPNMVIQEGDILVLYTSPEALYLYNEKILQGV